MLPGGKGMGKVLWGKLRSHWQQGQRLAGQQGHPLRGRSSP